MQITVQAYSVTEKYVSLGLILDHGGPIQFGLLKLPIDDPKTRAIVDLAADTIARLDARRSRQAPPTDTAPLF